MNNLGKKIKELRKKSDMTQEKLAEYLNVSFQAISKWETGIATPDISLIVPIAMLFKVTTDELLGFEQNAVEARKTKFRNMWATTWQSGDTTERYRIAKLAAEEFPNNFEFLVWLADAEIDYANHNFEYGSKERRDFIEKGIRHYELILEDCNDITIRNDVIHSLVMNLPNVDRREEAIKYAKMHPNTNELLVWCLRGEELQVHRQKMIEHYMSKLVISLEANRQNINAIEAAEAIIKTIIDDENYLFYNAQLMFNNYLQAAWLANNAKFDEAIQKLESAYKYALASDENQKVACESSFGYTCTILNKVKYEKGEFTKIGTESEMDNFRQLLRREEFSHLRGLCRFEELLKI